MTESQETFPTAIYQPVVPEGGEKEPTMKTLSFVVLFSMLFISKVLAEEISVPADTDGEEIVVTATRYKEAQSAVPANVTVITEEDIKKSTATTIHDLLRTQPGVQVSDIAGNGRNINVDLRGFGETASLNTLVLVDGRRVNEADLSGVDWIQIPLDRVKRIEIIRGGRGGVLYGDNATGGVINIITKEGDRFKTGVKVSGGSYDTLKSDGYVSGSIEDLAYSLSGSYLTTDNYRDNSDLEARDLGMNLGYYLNDFVKLKFSAGYHTDEAGLPGSLRESDFVPGAGRFPSGARRTDSPNPNDSTDVRTYYFKGGPEIWFGKDSLVAVDASFRKRDVLSSANFSLGSFTGDTGIKTTAVSPHIVLKEEVWGHKNTLSSGFDYQNSTEDISNDSIFSGSRTISAFELQKKNYGFYLHDAVSVLDRLSLSAGYRYDKADFTFSPSSPKSAGMDENLSTSGLTWQFNDSSHAYFSYARSFRYPVLDELFSFFTNTIDTGLRPQTSNNFELGAGHAFSKDLSAKLSLFRQETRNEILFNPTTFANENLDGKTRRDGVEISFDAKVFDWMALNGSYTYLRARIRGGAFAGSDFPGAARHKATFGALLSYEDRCSLALNGYYVGERPFISDFTNNFSDQKSYTVLNTRLKYRWEVLTAFLDIRNLTNAEYSEYGVIGTFPTEKAFFPSPKINFLFGLSADF